MSLSGGVDEQELVRRAGAGDSLAVGELYDLYVEQIYRFHYWQTNKHTQAAEDLTQETFLEMAKSVGKFQARSSFKNWLYVIAKRQLSKWIKKKYEAYEVPLFETLTDSACWIDPKEQDEKIKQLEAVFRHLNDREVAVLKCRYLQNLTVAETAKEVGISIANVKVLSHRALKRLRAEIFCNSTDTISVHQYVEGTV